MKIRQLSDTIAKGCAGLRVGAFLLLMGAITTGCQQDTPEPGTEVVRTVLFYLAGDNNLSGETTEKIEWIKSAPLSASCRVLIYKDLRNEAPQLLELKTENRNTEAIVVRTYNEANSASAETLATVLQEVKGRYPSTSYGLLVFSHASGWMPAGTFNNPGSRSAPASRSIIIDGTSEMELPDFAAAIPDGMFDFIIFEACHMAGIEVAWELKGKTHYIIASSAEIVSPGFAPVYSQVLPGLFAQVPQLEGFIRGVETDYLQRTGDYASLTLSLINTQKLDALAAVLQSTGFTALVKTVNGIVAGKEEEGSRASLQLFDRNHQNLFFDLADCYKRCMTANEAASLQRLLDEVVCCKAATSRFMPAYGGFDIRSHSGLTVYIPQTKYPALNEAYKQLKWYKEVVSLME